jgi:hypothetical protein
MVDFNSNTLAGGTKESLMYPRDMTGEDFYPESIRFGIFTRQGPSYDKIKEQAGSTAKAFGEIGSGSNEALDQNQSDINIAKRSIVNKTNTQKAKDETISALESTRRELQGQRAKEQTKSAVGQGEKFLNTLQTEFENRKPTLDAMTSLHIQSIYLNMPSSVAFNEAVQWQGSDLGVIGALKAGGDNMGSNALESGLLSNAGSMLGGAALALGGGIAGGVVGAVLGSGGLQSGIESTFNVKANPYKEQTFEGVDFRTFDFAFTFRARSQGDVNMIQNIITSFRACSKPTYDGDNGKTGVFAYPKEFWIEFLTLDANNSYQTNTYLPELKTCVCTGVNTNFTGSGWRSFAGGAPVDISLQLTFAETEIITGEDVLGATVAGRFAGKKRRF